MKPKKERDKDIHNMQTKIIKHCNDIWIPSLNLKSTNIETNSWFNITEIGKRKQKFISNKFQTEKLNEVSYKSKKILLNLSTQQKNIINGWLNSYLEMYNYSINYIKENIQNDKTIVNFINLRKLLKNERDKIKNKSTISTHDTDYAIKNACTMYKSALQNFKKGHIKHFRLRPLKKTKPIKVMDIESCEINNKGIRHKLLGSIKGYYNSEEFNFENIKCNCKLQKKNDKYYLFVPEEIEKDENIKQENEQITIDPGIRTFLTGITENRVVKIAQNCTSKLRDYFKRKDKIMNNEKIEENIKKKNEKMINNKISNLVDDLHWKTINYLTNKNKTILMGNMSTKSIVSKKESTLNQMTKRIGLNLKLFVFKERLKFKCEMKNVKYGEINEWMTSKMCSKCGNIHTNLGGNEKYECEKCGLKIDRDVNGARNIHIRAII